MRQFSFHPEVKAFCVRRDGTCRHPAVRTANSTNESLLLSDNKELGWSWWIVCVCVSVCDSELVASYSGILPTWHRTNKGTPAICHTQRSHV